ncbi:related to C6 transcription factor [Fusarium torulosum]|uniref:Related to C6 transcription factor n=1 Tax=Fusarium torulosum TaxID=33205 RepID=A0AAE8SH88_9HYPO|nr:related to C6 transcription factor [Fusarium torulosum]
MPNSVPHKPPGSPRAARKSRTARSKYVLRACQECHRRRAKCDGQRPSCSRCLARGLSCVFSTNVDHRGSAPRSHVSLLQARIALLEQVLQLHEIDIDASIACITAQKAKSEAGLPSPDVVCQKDSQDVLNGRDRDEPFFGAASGRLEIPTEPNFALPSYNNNPHISCSDDKLMIPQNQLQGLFSPKAQTPAPGSYKSAELQEHLINLFFEWEQPWLQVVDEALFRDSRRSNGRYHSALLLDCMMALASRYSDRPDVRSDLRDSDTAGMAFMQSAEVRLQGELKWPTITTVQSLAIMAIFYVAIGSDAAGWLHHGMAIRLVLDMGFNLDTTADVGLCRLTDAEVQLRRQIYWALYCSDKLWASYTGRVCTMLDSQGSVPLMENPLPNGNQRDSVETSGPSRPLLPMFLRYLSTQCQILERILTNLYAPKGLETAQKRQSFFDSCFLDVQNWFFALPKELKIDPDQPSASPHLYILHMCFHTCIILLAKPFLPKNANPLESNLAVEACRQAAKDICHLGNRYRTAFGSFRRSPITATHCTLTATLMVMFLGNGSRGDLDCCLLTLGELAESWAPAKRYWQTLSRVLGHRHNSEDGDITASSKVNLQDGKDVTDQSQVWNLAGPFHDMSAQLMELHPRSFEDTIFDTMPAIDFGQVDFEQLGFNPFGVLPFDYIGYDVPSSDSQWMPQI